MCQTDRLGQQAAQGAGWQRAKGRAQSAQHDGRGKDHLDLAGRISQSITEAALLPYPERFHATWRLGIPFQNMLDKTPSF
jgi:hypothetical protein